MSFRNARAACSALLALAAAAAVQAQARPPSGAPMISPYVLPLRFDAWPGGTVSADAGYTQKAFVPATALGETRFAVTGPDGKETPVSTIHQMKARTVLEFALPAEKEAASGTWRISSGQRMGRIFRTWERNGKVERITDAAQVMPPDATLRAHYQTVAQAESYVSVGEVAPAGPRYRTALKARDKGLELVPASHPNTLRAGAPFQFAVHFDGQPLAGNTVLIYASGMAIAKESAAHAITTGKEGRATFTPAQGGTYLAFVRHDSAAPPGSAAPTYGHRYALTFQVLDK